MRVFMITGVTGIYFNLPVAEQKYILPDFLLPLCIIFNQRERGM